MAKPVSNPLQPSDSDPGAAPSPDTAPEIPAAMPPANTFRYRVNWRFDGFREDVLEFGDTVEDSEDEAAPFVGGVLTLLQEV